jgi:hypothetical protein
MHINTELIFFPRNRRKYACLYIKIERVCNTNRPHYEQSLNDPLPHKDTKGLLLQVYLHHKFSNLYKFP